MPCLLLAVGSIGCATPVCPAGLAFNGTDCSALTLVVLDTFPVDAATEAAVDTNPTAQFDSDLDPSTVNVTTFLVSTSVGPIDGQAGVSETPGLAVFTPSGRLPLLVSHDAIVTTEIQSLMGTTLVADVAWSFVTRDGVWTTPEAMEPVEGVAEVSEPQVAFDASGNAMAVWEGLEVPSNLKRIMASRFTLSDGWDLPEQISDFGGPDASSPHLAVDDEGNALAVWEQFGSTGERAISSNDFSPEEGWSEIPQNPGFSVFAGNATKPRVSMTGGRGIAVWRQEDAASGVHRIFSNRFVGGSWRVPFSIDDQTGDADSPDIGMDRDGNAIVVWQQLGGAVTPRFDIWSARFDQAEMSWDPAELVETQDAGNATSPKIAVGGNGGALVVWEQFDGNHTQIWSNTFVAPDWRIAVPIEVPIAVDEPGESQAPAVAVDDSGKGLAVWHHADDESSTTRSSQYLGIDEWTIPVVIEEGEGGIFESARVAIDPHGNAVATGSRSEGNVVWRNRLAADAGWGEAERIGVGGSGPAIDVDSLGRALLLWGEGEQVQWSRFE